MNQASTATWTTSSLAVPGVRLHVKRTGAGDPLLLVHGKGTDCTTWDGVAPALTGDHTWWCTTDVAKGEASTLRSATTARTSGTWQPSWPARVRRTCSGGAPVATRRWRSPSSNRGSFAA